MQQRENSIGLAIKVHSSLIRVTIDLLKPDLIMWSPTLMQSWTAIVRLSSMIRLSELRNKTFLFSSLSRRALTLLQFGFSQLNHSWCKDFLKIGTPALDSLKLANTDSLFLHTTNLPEANTCSPSPAHVRIWHVQSLTSSDARCAGSGWPFGIASSFLPGPSRRQAPVIKCNAFLCFQSYIVRDISLTEIYRWLVTFIEILSAILKSTSGGVKRKIIAFWTTRFPAFMSKNLRVNIWRDKSFNVHWVYETFTFLGYPIIKEV